MSRLAESRSRLLARVGVLALIAAGLGGCSGDIARFTEKTFASAAPARPGQNDVTGSLPSGRVDSQALPATSGGVSGGGGGIGSYQPPANPARISSTVPARPAAVPAPPSPPTGAIAMHQVAPGETLTSIA